MRLRVIDFETDGMPPDARVCEVGFCDVVGRDADPTTGLMQWQIGEPEGMLVNPRRPMPPEARAIHHISDADLVGAPPIEVGFRKLMDGFPTAFVAHNARFEMEFFTGGETPWICTLKVARRLWPECPSHTNQCLRYFLKVELDEALAMPPHRASPDAYVTGFILMEALKLVTVEDMIAWSSAPSLLPRVTFGKHRGQAWSELPGDYLSWLVNKSDMDVDTKFTAKHWLEQKRRVGA
jgi:exodeoxyribonuclease X